MQFDIEHRRKRPGRYLQELHIRWRIVQAGCGSHLVLLKFADCELDPDRLELARAGRCVPMQPQVRELLTYLIENRDRAVGREELYRAIWGPRLVTDATLNSRVRAARAAIGDDGRAQRLIRTLPRIGYRFVGEVVEERASLRAAPESKDDVGAIVAGTGDLQDVDLSLPSRPSLVVLPFRVVGETSAGPLLAEGLTNDIITQVARSRWLFVVARGTALKFRRGPYDPGDVGQALGIRYVVQGAIWTVGGRIRLQVELADAVAGEEIWAENYWRDPRDIVAVQAEISEVIVGVIEAEIEHAERRRSLLMAPASLDAWSAYHRGCWHMYRFTPKHYDLSEQCFKRSLELDPTAPRAYAGLSFIHWQRAFLELSADKASETDKALAFAEESLAIDPLDPLGHWALGRAYLLKDDLDLAVDELDASVTLNPSSAVGQYSLSYALMQVGDAMLSNEIVARARRLSPYDAMTFAMYAVRAQNLAFMGEHTEAARYAARAARQPNAHYHVIAIAAFCSMLAGDPGAAKHHYSRLKAIRPDYSSDAYLTAFRHRRERNARLVRRTFRALASLG